MDNSKIKAKFIITSNSKEYQLDFIYNGECLSSLNFPIDSCLNIEVEEIFLDDIYNYIYDNIFGSIEGCYHYHMDFIRESRFKNLIDLNFFIDSFLSKEKVEILLNDIHDYIQNKLKEVQK